MQNGAAHLKEHFAEKFDEHGASVKFHATPQLVDADHHGLCQIINGLGLCGIVLDCLELVIHKQLHIMLPPGNGGRCVLS